MAARSLPGIHRGLVSGSVCVPLYRAGSNTGKDADRRARGSGSGVVRRLQRQPRVAHSEGRPHDGDPQHVEPAGHRRDRWRRVPRGRNEECQTGIGQVDAGLQFDRRIRTIVAGLQTRFPGRIQIVVMLIDGGRMPSRRRRVGVLFGIVQAMCKCFAGVSSRQAFAIPETVANSHTSKVTKVVLRLVRWCEKGFMSGANR